MRCIHLRDAYNQMSIKPPHKHCVRVSVLQSKTEKDCVLWSLVTTSRLEDGTISPVGDNVLAQWWYAF